MHKFFDIVGHICLAVYLQSVSNKIMHARVKTKPTVVQLINEMSRNVIATYILCDHTVQLHFAVDHGHNCYELLVTAN